MTSEFIPVDLCAAEQACSGALAAHCDGGEQARRATSAACGCPPIPASTCDGEHCISGGGSARDEDPGTVCCKQRTSCLLRVPSEVLVPLCIGQMQLFLWPKSAQERLTKLQACCALAMWATRPAQSLLAGGGK